MSNFTYRQCLGLVASGSLFLILLAACDNSELAQNAADSPKTYAVASPERAMSDYCAPAMSPFRSVVDLMNCVGAALGEQPPGEPSSSIIYLSRKSP